MGTASPTYEVSAAGSIATGSNIWIVLRPLGVPSQWPYLTTSCALEVYVQVGSPTSASTPVFSTTVAYSKLDSIAFFARTTSEFGDFEFRFVDPNGLGWTVPIDCPAVIPNAADAGSTMRVSTGTNTFLGTGVVYLGTDNVFESVEVT